MSEPKSEISSDESVLGNMGIQNPTSSGPNNNFVTAQESSKEQVYAELDLIFQQARLNENNDLNATKPSGNLSYSYHLEDSCFSRSLKANDSVYLGKSLLKFEGKTFSPIAEKIHKLVLRKAVHGNVANGHFVIKNVGKEAAFVKILPFYDSNLLNEISADIVSPQACVILEKELQHIFVFLKNLPEDYFSSEPFGYLGIFSGDETVRQRFIRETAATKSSDEHSILRKINFLEPFDGKRQAPFDSSYVCPKFEDVFYSSVTTTKVQLFVKEDDMNMDPKGLNVGFCEASDDTLSPESL